MLGCDYWRLDQLTGRQTPVSWRSSRAVIVWLIRRFCECLRLQVAADPRIEISRQADLPRLTAAALP